MREETEGKKTMQPFTENVDKLRGKQESLAFWQRRRRFLAVHWNKFPMEELNNLSYCYSSVMVYSCRYSPEIMNRLYDLAMEVASHQQKEGERNARRPQEIQEKWELAMTEPDTFGRIMLNTGEDPTGEWTENEREEDDDGGQKPTDVEERGQNYCTVQGTPHKLLHLELKTQTGKATNKIKQFSAKADPCLQRNHEENLPLNESAPLSSTDPIDEQTNPLKRSMVQQKKSWQQNTGVSGVSEQSPYSRDNNYYKDTISTNTISPHQGVIPSERSKSENQELRHSPQAYQMHSDLPRQKNTANTASFLNRHCMVERSPNRSLTWHPLIQTGVKEKTRATQPLGADGMYKCIDKKLNGAGIGFSSSTGIQNKAESPHPSIPGSVSSKLQLVDLDRKEKVVTFRTQSTFKNENKSSGKKTCVKKECANGVVKAPNVNFREFYTPKRNHSSHVLNNRYSTPQPHFQSRLYHNEYVTLKQRDQGKLSAASKPHPKALEGGMCRKGLLPNSDEGHLESQAREKDLKFKQAKCASKDLVEEVLRKKSYTQENTSRRPHSQGGRMTRVVYPSVKSKPTIGGKAGHLIKPAIGKSSILSSRANQGHWKSLEPSVKPEKGYKKGLETGVKQRKADQGYSKSLEPGAIQRQADTGTKPSQRPEGGKPNRSLLKTFLHNLLQKARN